MLGLPGVAAAVPAAEPVRVAASLVADADETVPGQPIRLGARLEIAPGWHVYWSNPGDSGLSTAVDPELPAGWTGGEIQWPVPIRFEQPGGLVGYGYEHEVVLIRELVPAPGASGPVSIPVTVSWLACKDVCLLGDARLELVLPAPTGAAQAGRALLDAWSARLPRCGEGDEPFTATTRQDGASGSVGTWLRWRDPVADVVWFPETAETVRIEDVKVVTRGGLTRIDLSVRPAAGARLPAEMASLVAWTDPTGRRRGRCLPIHLQQP